MLMAITTRSRTTRAIGRERRQGKSKRGSKHVSSSFSDKFLPPTTFFHDDLYACSTHFFCSISYLGHLQWQGLETRLRKLYLHQASSRVCWDPVGEFLATCVDV